MTDDRRKRPGHSDPKDDLDLERRGPARRLTERIALRIWAEDTSPEGDFAYHTCSDLSLGGIFLESTEPPQAGSRIHLEFRLPGAAAHPISVLGEVVSSLDADSAMENMMGFGVAFIGLKTADRERIQNYIAKSRP